MHNLCGGPHGVEGLANQMLRIARQRFAARGRSTLLGDDADEQS